MSDATPHADLVDEQALAEGKRRSAERAARPNLSSQYRPTDFFLIRSPVFPLQRFAAWSDQNCDFASTPARDPETRWAQRCAALSSALRTEFAAPALREALYFASPDLEESIAQQAEGAPLAPRFARTLTRYLARAAARETPFGRFASVSFGRVSNQVCLDLSASGHYRRYTSVAMSYLHQILRALAARAEVRDGVVHELNSTLIRGHDYFRFAARESDRSLGNSLIEIDASAALERAVSRAERGATPAQLARALARGHLKYEAALELARTLCERDFVVPAWLPAVTGADSSAAAIRELEPHPALSGAAACLRTVETALREADNAQGGAGPAAYRRASELLSRVCPPATHRHALQTELGLSSPALSIDERLANRLLAAANVLQRTGSGYQNPELAEFRRRFVDRYEGRWVALSEALEENAGIGFGPPDALESESLLEGLPFRVRAQTQTACEPFDRARLQLLHRALVNRSQVVQLDDELLDAFSAAPLAELPESMAVMARLARAVDGSLLLVTPLISAPSAVSTLARFCNAQPELEPALRRLVSAEQQLAGDTLLADIAYFPGADSANIVVRPVLRAFEIPYLGKSGAAPEQQLPISDLLVSVEGERVVLGSARHGKRLKIRIGNALNSTHEAHPVLYRFLAALQVQDATGLVSRWSWGLLENAPFLPRVVHGSAVLGLATWRLSARELEPLLAARGARAFALVQELRRELCLPRFLNRGSTDDRLLVDLDNELSVDELLHAARKQHPLVLEELLPAPDALALRGPAGALAAELVVPFLRRASAPPISAVPRAAVRNPALGEHRLPPGSTWLYAKIYAGRAQLDSIMAQLRESLIAPLRKSGLKSWFYLPYADPEPHLRLRLEGAPGKSTAHVLLALRRALAPLLEKGEVWRWQVDTYDREVERYGGLAGVKLAERFFWADSEAACQVHELIEHDGELRWQFALLGIDRLLGDAGLGLSERVSFAERARQGYGVEQGATPATWKAAGDKYRGFAPGLTQLLWQPRAQLSLRLQRAHQLFDQRSEQNAALWPELRAARQAGAVNASDTDLLLSFAHLHAIRVLGISARRFELVLYDFLRRLYSARLASSGARAVADPS